MSGVSPISAHRLAVAHAGAERRRRGGWLALLLAVLVGVAGCTEEPSDQEYFSRAQAHYERGELAASTIELRNALRRNPDHRQARRLLGKLYVQGGDGAAAERELSGVVALSPAVDESLLDLGKALLLQEKYQAVLNQISDIEGFAVPDRVALRILRGQAYLGLGELTEARSELQAALDLEPSAREALLTLARLAGHQGQLFDMQEQLDQLLAHYSEDGEVWSLQGDLYEQRGQFEAAEEAYSKAIVNRTDSKVDYLNRAFVRMRRGNYEAATSDVETFVQWAPHSARGRLAKAILAYQAKRYGDAENLLTEALNQEFSPLVIYYLGAVNFDQGHYEQAQQYLNAYLTYDPDAAEVRKSLAIIYLSQKDYAKARSVLQPHLENVPDDVQGLSLLADILLAQGQTAAAITILSKVIELDPDAGRARAQLGLSLLQEGQIESGIATLRATRQLHPDLPQLDVVLAMNLLHLGRLDEALEVARQLQARRPDDPAALSLLGTVLVQQGQVDEARTLLQAARRLAPANPVVSQRLAQLLLSQGDTAGARAIYLEVLKANPGYLPTLLALAALAQQQGDTAAARDWLEQARRDNPAALQPRLLLARDYLNSGQPQPALELLRVTETSKDDQPALLELLGEAQLADGRFAEAVATLEKRTSLPSPPAQTFFLLAQAYDAQRNTYRSRLALNEALRLDPQHLAARLAWFRQLVLQGDQTTAQSWLTALRRDYPDHPEVLAQAGWLALQQERYSDAIAVLNAAQARLPTPSSAIAILLAQARWRAGQAADSLGGLETWLKQQPGDLNVRLALGEFYLAAGRLDEATALYRKVLEQAPNNVVALNNLAELLHSQAPDQAMQYAEQAMILNPEVPAVQDTLASLLLDQGQTERALALLQKAAAGAPDNPNIRYRLARALADSGATGQACALLEALLQDNRPFRHQADARALLERLRP